MNNQRVQAINHRSMPAIAFRSSRKLQWLATSLAIICTAPACTSERTSDSSQTESDSSESTDSTDASGNPVRKMLPLEEQPGYHVFPYASCPVRENWEELCGGEGVRGFCIRSQGDDGYPYGSICNAKCNDDDSCIPLGNVKMVCAHNGGDLDGCYASCKEDSDCPKEMICINLPGTGMCGWPILYE